MHVQVIKIYFYTVPLSESNEELTNLYNVVPTEVQLINLSIGKLIS